MRLNEGEQSPKNKVCQPLMQEAVVFHNADLLIST